MTSFRPISTTFNGLYDPILLFRPKLSRVNLWLALLRFRHPSNLNINQVLIRHFDLKFKN